MNLQEISDSLDITFLADKLRQSCLMLAHQRVYKIEYKMGLLDEVIQTVVDGDFLKIPAIAIYYYGYKCTVEKDVEAHFHHLKTQIEQNGHLFPPSEIREIYLMAINYCIGKINAGQEPFFQEAFDLYRLGFEEGILIKNNNISRWTFLNVVLNALRLKKFDWAEEFIANYNKYLEPRYANDFVNYCSARLYFETKKYNDARQLLVQIQDQDMLINLIGKTLLAKLYYEELEFDALESLLGSMRTYLQRKEIMGYHKQNFENIITYTRKLVRINPYDKKEREKLRTEIIAAPNLTEREWLLEQIENL